MSAATDILNAVKAIVEASALAPRKVFVRRASDMNPAFADDMAPGETAPGFGPCFAASCNSERPTRMAWAGKKYVKYTVALAYLTKELAGERDADTPTSLDVEDTLAAASRLFQSPRKPDGKPGLAGVPTVSKCNVKPGKPYTLPFRDQEINASVLLLEFENLEDAR